MEGWHGWDQYAQFYDWENARTVGRRDISFWQDLAKAAIYGVGEHLPHHMTNIHRRGSWGVEDATNRCSHSNDF